MNFVDGHWQHDEETKNRISLHHMGIKPSIEVRLKLSLAKKGKPLSLEHRLKLSQVRKGRKSWNKGKTGYHTALLGTKRSETFCKMQSERMKGEKHPLWGKHFSIESKLKMSMSQKERFMNHPHIPLSTMSRLKISEALKGRKFSFEHREKLSKAAKLRSPISLENKLKRSLSMKEIWKRTDYVEKVTKLMMLGNKIKPNKKEKMLIDFFSLSNLPYSFVGDGKVILGGKCPDFINTNGQKKIIEVFGDYWHNNSKTKYHQTEQGRKEHYTKYGYDTLVIWEHELKDFDNAKQRIIEFDACLKQEE